MGWCISVLLLPIAHYFLPHFRYMQFCVVGYELIFLIWLWELPESPRWLITHDRFDDAAKLISKTAKALNKLTDIEIDRKIEKLRRYVHKEDEQLKLEAKMTILDMWRQPTLFRYCVLLYVISVCFTFIGYSISYNASAYGGSLYVTMFLQGLSDFFVFSTLYFCVDRFSRKSLAMIVGCFGALFIWLMLPFTFDSSVRATFSA